MVNQKLEGDRLHTISPVGACHTLAGAFATMANNVVFVPMDVVKHCCSCGGVLIQWDVGIFFPHGGGSADVHFTHHTQQQW